MKKVINRKKLKVEKNLIFRNLKETSKNKRAKDQKDQKFSVTLIKVKYPIKENQFKVKNQNLTLKSQMWW